MPKHRLCSSAVIDNDQLTNVLRLQYLKSAVKGEASKMLTSINITDDNFDVAMEILQNRYANKGLILRAHFHRIVSFCPVSNENTRELRKLVVTMEKQRLFFGTRDNQLSVRTHFCLLDCRKTARRNTKVLGAFFKGEITTDISGTKHFPGGTCSSLGVSITKQQFIKYRKTVAFITKSSTETTSHSCYDNESTMRIL